MVLPRRLHRRTSPGAGDDALTRWSGALVQVCRSARLRSQTAHVVAERGATLEYHHSIAVYPTRALPPRNARHIFLGLAPPQEPPPPHAPPSPPNESAAVADHQDFNFAGLKPDEAEGRAHVGDHVVEAFEPMMTAKTRSGVAAGGLGQGGPLCRMPRSGREAPRLEDGFCSRAAVRL